MGTYSALAAKSRHFVFWGGREGGESADRLVDRAG
jgi:xylose isomerase